MQSKWVSFVSVLLLGALIVLIVMFALSSQTPSSIPSQDQAVNGDETRADDPDQSNANNGNGHFREIDKEEAPQDIQVWVEQSLEMALAQSMNFENKTYILITRGTMPTAGYEIHLEQVRFTDEAVEIHVNYTDPQGAAAEVITYPYKLIVMDMTEKPIRFIETDGNHIPVLHGIDHLLPIESASDNVKLFKPVQEKDHLTIHGVTRVFEGVLQYETIDRQGKIIKEGVIRARAGTGTWGYFSLNLEKTVLSPADKLFIFSQSPKDGSRIPHLELDLAAYK